MNKIVLTNILKKKISDETTVVAISGFGGSGKSTLARAVANELGKSEIISVDDFAISRLNKRSSDWDSFDWSRFENEILIPLSRKDKEINYGVYDWEKDSIKSVKNILVSKFTILEGVGLFRKVFMKYFDYSIWINCPLGVASERGRKRDNELYKVNHDKEWTKIWTPNDRDYFEKYHPDLLADITVPFQD